MRSVEIYGGDLFSKEDLHNYLADSLGFPSYYGHNLDALNDCLTDISEDTELILYDPDYIVDCVGEEYYRRFCKVLDDAAEENDHFSWTEE